MILGDDKKLWIIPVVKQIITNNKASAFYASFHESNKEANFITNTVARASIFLIRFFKEIFLT